MVDPLQSDRTLDADTDTDRVPVVRLAPDPNSTGDDPHGIPEQSGLDPIRRLPKTDPLDDDMIDRLPPVEPGILLPDDKLMRIESAAADDADANSTPGMSPTAEGDASAGSLPDDGSSPTFGVRRLPALSTEETASRDSSMPAPDPLLRYLPPVPSEAERATDVTLNGAASDAKNPLPLQGPLVITDEPAKPVAEAAPQGPWGVVIPPPVPDESSSMEVPPEPADPLVRLPEVEPAAPTDRVELEPGRGVRLAPPEDLGAAVGAPADALRVSQQPIAPFDPSSRPAETSIARREVFAGAPQRLSIQDGSDEPLGCGPVPCRFVLSMVSRRTSRCRWTSRRWPFWIATSRRSRGARRTWQRAERISPLVRK